jgi:hypothetical protein
LSDLVAELAELFDGTNDDRRTQAESDILSCLTSNPPASSSPAPI